MKPIAAAAAAFGLGLVCGAGGLALALAPDPRFDVRVLGSIDLGQAFPQMAGYSLNFRQITVAPGGTRALHSHKESPEIVHIVSGVLTERREGQPPRTLVPGDTKLNDQTVTHALVNQGAVPVVYFAANVAKTP